MFFSLGASASQPSVGGDEQPAINFVVWTKDGSRISYRMSEHPVITTSGETLILTTRNESVEFLANDVKKFTFEPVYYFVTWLNDGCRCAYALAEHPVVTYSDGELLLDTRHQQVSYAATEVRKFTFSASDISCEGELPPTTGVVPAVCESQLLLAQGDVLFNGCKAGSTVGVYTMDGKLLHSVQADENGNAILSLSAYPAGIYIIRTETITHKIIKR